MTTALDNQHRPTQRRDGGAAAIVGRQAVHERQSNSEEGGR
ncbi:hypothetical protein SAMN05192558_11561 [Actinokineospora alba]|uniref:Uncharacterized protein n=1 Tax=Actinokineospora alba TaxID=504798 RepID=A0A1H0VSP1_9PSEU|nr:hypothetical protein C8E96_5739 [Actinokineospora alba]SDI38203.1 hypothetical protein SAMN05421871_104412 [Actinokineospora alba]SDP81116.1 hypothetical protein SAMN05192558_11561 [Actinokineospora alba]